MRALLVLAALWWWSRMREPITAAIVGPKLPGVRNGQRLDGLADVPRLEALNLIHAWRIKMLGWPAGWEIGITAGRRTAAEQAELYAKGRTAPGRIVTHRDGYQVRSTHQDEVAFDFVLYFRGQPVWEDPDAYLILGEMAEARGWTWGGRWQSPHDPYHLEWRR